MGEASITQHGQLEGTLIKNDGTRERNAYSVPLCSHPDS